MIIFNQSFTQDDSEGEDFEPGEGDDDDDDLDDDEEENEAGV